MDTALNGLYLTEPQEPASLEFNEADGIHVKAIRFHATLPSVGDQHAHAFDHVSVVIGPFRVYIGNEYGIPPDAYFIDIGGIDQPFTIRIPAHKFHRFVSLLPGGVLLCISNDHGTQGQIIEKYAKVS